MFEIILAFVYAVLILYVDSLLWMIVLTVIFLILVLPGIYSMFFGAPFVISLKSRVEAILKLGNFSVGDRVVELGCGDARIIRKVAKKGVKEAIGYEFSVPTFLFAKLLTFLAHGKEKIKFKNFWRADLSRFDVVICFLMKETMFDFEKKIWPNLKKGTRVISNSFKMKNVVSVKSEDGVHLYVKNN